jgi:hypothetical protein
MVGDDSKATEDSAISKNQENRRKKLPHGCLATGSISGTNHTSAINLHLKAFSVPRLVLYSPQMGHCDHRMGRPRVADEGTASNMEGKKGKVRPITGHQGPTGGVDV